MLVVVEGNEVDEGVFFVILVNRRRNELRVDVRGVILLSKFVFGRRQGN